MEKKKVKGIKNLKNTCFINAVVQSLYLIKPFKNYISKAIPQTFLLKYVESLQEKDPSYKLVFELKILFNLFREESQVIIPTQFVKSSFALFTGEKPYTQQDSQEYLYLLLDKISSEISDIFEETPSIISETFDGEISTVYKCLTDNCQEIRDQNFLQIALPVPQNIFQSNLLNDLHEYQDVIVKHESSCMEKILSFCRRNRASSVYDCLRLYFSTQNLAECPKCEKINHCELQEKFKKLPNYLIISLKRFESNGKNSSKLSNRIYMPENLNLQEFTSENNPEYELSSLINHRGGVGRGHYTAYIKKKSQWYFTNDSSVKPCTWESAFKSQCYIAIYSRRILKINKVISGDFYLPKQIINKYLHLYEPGTTSLKGFICSHGKVSKKSMENTIGVDKNTANQVLKILENPMEIEGLHECEESI